jgi:subtilisin family serine protease
MSSIPERYEGEMLPDVVMGYVSVRGEQALDQEHWFEPTKGAVIFRMRADTAAPFRALPEHDEDAKKAIAEAELTIVAESRLGMAVAGPPKAFENLTGGRVRAYEKLVGARGGRSQFVTHLDITDGELDQPREPGRGKPKEAALDAVVLERPRAALGLFPTPIPPPVSRFHLRVLDDVAAILGATRAHLRGHRGDGVSVAMVDTGWYRHPFFDVRGFNVVQPISVVPGTDPNADPHGHGTGESANLFAVAPGATLLPVRASNGAGALVGAVAGFIQATQLNPAVITNSWGGDYPDPVPRWPDAIDLVLALEIVDAIESGIVVVFSAGNGSFGAEAQVPGVIAAGGVYASAGLELQASSYTSGYHSGWFGGVDVPTVCGLVGMSPRASYLMLPVPSGSTLDMERAVAGGGDPPDGTTPYDGWALFSGTSAAAPQLAGAAAVLRGINPGATPAEVRQALCLSAIDVRAGFCNARFNNPATPGHDLATGDGLINVAGAAARFDPSAYAPQEPDLQQGRARGAAPATFEEVVLSQGLALALLERLVVDSEFRKLLVSDFPKAMQELGVTGTVSRPAKIDLALPEDIQAMLDAIKKGDPTAGLLLFTARAVNVLSV